jgi:ribonuclease HII
MKSTSIPTLDEEVRFWSEGCSWVAGLDEVGRGPIAGPVVAAAVAIAPDCDTSVILLARDSKQLSPSQRERIAAGLRAALPYGVGLANVEEIDRLGIARASRLAMTRAVAAMHVAPEALLLDAFKLPESTLPQTALIRGDSRCASIAAASVIAKVERDSLMGELDLAYPGYGFDRHKGYATSEHLARLQQYGPSPMHRMSFAPLSQWAFDIELVR